MSTTVGCDDARSSQRHPPEQRTRPDGDHRAVRVPQAGVPPVFSTAIELELQGRRSQRQLPLGIEDLREHVALSHMAHSLGDRSSQPWRGGQSVVSARSPERAVRRMLAEGAARPKTAGCL